MAVVASPTPTSLKTFGQEFLESPFDFDSTMSPEEMFQDNASIADSEESSDKPNKKRRSWGQQLPTPTTNLPPRKRAKTEAEKEQRRIERVIRNRLAAHSSRERKRKEVEHLEDQKSVVEAENAKLRSQLISYASKNAALTQQIKQLQAELGRPVSDIEVKEEPLQFPPSPPHSTNEEDSYNSTSPETSNLANSTDMTQHPAVSVPEESKIEVSEPMSRRSSTSLTTASTCHSSPLPEAATFDDLFGTACETPTVLTEFDSNFMMDLDPKKNHIDPFGFDMINFDFDNTKQLVEDFINLDDQKDTYDQDHFVIFSNENQI